MSLCSFLRPVTLHWLFRRDGKKENQLMQNIYFCNLIEFNINSLRAARVSLSTCCYRQLKTFLFRTEGKVLDVWNSFPSSSADLSFNFSVSVCKVASHDNLLLRSSARFHKYFQEFWDAWMKCMIKWKWEDIQSSSVLLCWCLMLWLLCLA